MNEIYWITRLDAIQTLAIIAVFILGVLTSIYILAWFIEDDFKNDSKFKNMAIKYAAYISIPIFLLVFIPVSYTHLDVYKRQLLLRPKFPLINSGGVSGLSQPITFLFRQLLPSSQANDDHVRTHRVLID